MARTERCDATGTALIDGPFWLSSIHLNHIGGPGDHLAKSRQKDRKEVARRNNITYLLRCETRVGWPVSGRFSGRNRRGQQQHSTECRAFRIRKLCGEEFSSGRPSFNALPVPYPCTFHRDPNWTRLGWSDPTSPLGATNRPLCFEQIGGRAPVGWMPRGESAPSSAPRCDDGCLPGLRLRGSCLAPLRAPFLQHPIGHVVLVVIAKESTVSRPTVAAAACSTLLNQRSGSSPIASLLSGPFSGNRRRPHLPQRRTCQSAL